ncbi:putative armadillo-like helical protein [Helianthus annuus]|nr:putative armadillo-like helical protein [Helianthus annuus]
MLKAELRTIYSHLCQDDMPMVRRSASTNLGKFAATVEPAHLKTEIMQIFEDLTQGDQDSVCLLAVEGCAALGKLLEPQDCIDKSWRVRYMVANQLYELCEAVGPEPTKYHNEAEVRIAAAGKVTKFSRILSPELAFQHILPCVKELSSDSSQHVRSALASVIMGMAPVLGKVYSIREAVANILKRLAEEFGPDWAMQHIVPQVKISSLIN